MNNLSINLKEKFKIKKILNRKLNLLTSRSSRALMLFTFLFLAKQNVCLEKEVYFLMLLVFIPGSLNF